MRLGTILATVVLLSTAVAAQDKKDGLDSAQYKVEFHIRDSADNAGKGARHYTMMIDANSKGVFRVGNRVPYVTGSIQSNQGGPASTQYQYADVGVNIDTRLRDAGGDKVALTADLEISALVQQAAGAAVGANPTISSMRVSLNTVLSPGKPVLVASVEDPVTMRNFNIETTLTKLK